MGLNADAELIWGIPVQAHDDDGEPTEFWNEEDDDFREFEGDLEIRAHGHYEDPNGPLGILTTKRIESLIAYCGEPVCVQGLVVPVGLRRRCATEARLEGLAVDFYQSAGWYLVASYG